VTRRQPCVAIVGTALIVGAIVTAATFPRASTACGGTVLAPAAPATDTQAHMPLAPALVITRSPVSALAPGAGTGLPDADRRDETSAGAARGSR
jgi:hypothetical protein